MSDRRYTVDEANELLPALQQMLERLRDAQRVMAERHDEVMEATTHNGGGGAGKEFLEASQEAGRVNAEIQQLEIVVRDPETGLIDFPAERDGEEIYLCWRLGEDAVGWWHPTDSGFAGRQPL
ncbi:MAG TPA: DUF2203 domain-containing protein [Actinomycetota bacterium]|nr:DUF2203 domain-containing protein [Actinomycetota bacterium]